MGDANPIRTLEDYSKPSHEGYRNTIELPVGTMWYLFDPTPSTRNWLEHLPAGSITTWEDLTTRFLTQFFPPGRTAKLYNDILIFQQHHGESLSKAWTRFKNLFQKVPHHGIDLWLQVQIFYDHVNLITRRTIYQSVDGKLRNRNAKDSWALLEDLALYDNKSWNDKRDFAKPVKAISLPQDVLSTFASSSSSCCDATYSSEQNHYLIQSNLEGLVSNFMASQNARLSKFEANFKQQQSEMTNKIDTVLKAINDRMSGALPSDTVKNPKLNINSITLVLSARSYPTKDPQCSTHIPGSINTITIHPKQQSNSHDDKPEENKEKEKIRQEYINTNSSTPPDPSVSFITEKFLKLNSFFESLGLAP
ncbi:MAK10-like protein [Tanacetum coccineum]